MLTLPVASVRLASCEAQVVDHLLAWNSCQNILHSNLVSFFSRILITT